MSPASHLLPSCPGVESDGLWRLGHGYTAEAQPGAGRPKACVYQSSTSILPPDKPLWSSNQTQNEGGSLAWNPPTPLSARDMPGITQSRAGGKSGVPQKESGAGPKGPRRSLQEDSQSQVMNFPSPAPMSAKAKWGLTKVLQSQKNPMQSWPRV
ncbi:hypothetical protein D623_10014252 [Myotis brandtii]|uniref:Uncharacterized protein n=1 Tax=Myotis brandtii TaxID=109478 RepID=S7QFQ7_MYOBR|nr:hypothetical protein D623_10014252 [Myotis brandtii]